MIKNKKSGKTEFVEKVDGEEIVLESLDDFRNAPDSGFFPFINLVDSLDLTRYQIYNTIDKKNYRDNRFVYACIQSGVFTENDIHKLRSIMITRNIPNKKIRKIALEMKCHFVLYRVDDTKDSRTRRQLSIDTRKNSKVVADRVVQLLTKKDHFMIDMNEKLPITKYYIEDKDRLDKKYKKIPIAEHQ